MTAPLGELDPGEFLAVYWQKQPCLIRGALPGFKPPVDGDDLAGLACEELAESRIVSGNVANGEWRLRNGPFEESEFAALGDMDWTLLVQDVEKHYPPLQSLLDAFSFLPNWRLDDLMVSFAAPGGSVGPHVDQYDVFLLQVQGRRHWQIARQFEPGLVPGCPLNILADFNPERDWTLDPGDMLYLPPGVAHHGVALDPCLTYSIGLRAPSAADLHAGLGELLAEMDDQGGRYADPGLTTVARPGEIDRAALQGFRELLSATLDQNDEFGALIGTFLSRYRLAHEPASPPACPAIEQVAESLREGATFSRNPWTRINWLERDGRAQLHAAGSVYTCSIEIAQILCDSGDIRLDPDSIDDPSITLLQALIRDGHIILSL